MQDSDDDGCPNVVIDSGSSACRAGFTGYSTSVTLAASVAREHKGNGVLVGAVPYSLYDTHGLRAPLDRGIITHWDDMELVWRSLLTDNQKGLGMNPEEDLKSRFVLLSEVLFNPKLTREKMMEIMFETFGFGGFYVALQPLLAHYASGRKTSLSVHCGDGVTQIVPVAGNATFTQAIKRVNFGGSDITETLLNGISAEAPDLQGSRLKAYANSIKERNCYVASQAPEARDPDAPPTPFPCELPDGRVISMGDELERGPESLFQPTLLGLEHPGLHKLVYETVQRCCIDERRALYSNICLSGGTMRVRGVDARLHSELTKLVPTSVKVTVLPYNSNYANRPRSLPRHSSAETEHRARLDDVWLGGSILSSLDAFHDSWITRGEYDDYGSSCVHGRCNDCYLNYERV